MPKGKYFLGVWKEYRIFFLLMLVTDGFAGLFLWLMDRSEFMVIAGLLAAISFLLFLLAAGISCHREEKREQAAFKFFETLELSDADLKEGEFAPREGRQLRLAESRLREQEEQIKESRREREGYEEYIENWAHEMKLPLSLMTLMLDNRREEMSPLVHRRLEYARGQMQGYVEQLLYYARLKAVHKDYLFERVSIKECVDEVLEDYQVFLREQGFTVEFSGFEREGTQAAEVITDRKGLLFILGQITGNSVKYSPAGQKEKYLIFSVFRQKEKIVLSIKDNGIGVRVSELPFIFEKGFTGDTDGNRKKSTGMGLYLAKEMADDLEITLDARSEYRKGFEILLEFPKVKVQRCKKEE
jgi:signal transduction histidine kinase